LNEPSEVGHRLGGVARELGLEELRREIDATTERLEAGLFHVAFVGQFKRGKSMLMNALLGEPVMPVGVTPVTTAVVVVQHGRERRARVELRSGEWQDVAVSEIARFVTEEQNPSNRLGVRRVEVLLPSELLANGMCFVDTPGIGSVFEANTAETRGFVPQVDVAVAVLGSDPPISGDEIALLAAIATKTPRIVLVLNKCDRLTPGEVEQAAAFTERVVRERLPGPASRIFKVSAKEAVEAGMPTRDWADFRRALEELARGSGASLVAEASRRAHARFTAILTTEIDERLGALTRSTTETEKRIAELRACTAESERSLANLGYLLKAEEDRFDLRLERERETFLANERPALERLLREYVAGQPSSTRGNRLRARAFREVQRLVEERVLAWNAQLAPFAEELYREIKRGFVERSNVFVEELRRHGAAVAPDFEAILEPPLHARRGFYFNGLETQASPSPFDWVATALVPGAAGRRRIERSASSFLADLFETNSCRAVNDYKDRLVESRRRLESGLRAAMRELVARAERAHAEARRHRDEGAKAVERETDRLKGLRSRCE
jgi:GTP-binding protein EngB required for normal cell division